MIRFFDIIFSLIGLIVLLPLFFILFIFIKMDSKGSIFYKQIRVGKNFVDFKLYKFRSMKINSEHKGSLTISDRDPRITKVGYYLRKYKIDELPQIINVLKGEMSFVGPRPEVRKYITYYEKIKKEILSVKPGITDFASIQFANENEILAQSNEPEKAYIEQIIPIKLELNMKYINDQSIKMYFKIIFLTIKRIFIK